MKQKEQVANLLPAQAKQLFLDIADGTVLGASRHMEMIGEIFCRICRSYIEENKNLTQIKIAIFAVIDYMAQTRAKASQAIANAMDIMTAGFSEYDGTVESFAELVQTKVEAFRQSCGRCITDIVRYALNELKNKSYLMLFDYSSTVAKVLESLESRQDMHIYVPESRVIDGGKEYASIAAKKKFSVHFFPDAAMLFYLQRCQAALIGAETFYPDGTAFNTTGSDMLGLLCKNLGVPLYVLTPLIKVDRRATFGHRRLPVVRNLEKVLSDGLDPKDRARIDFDCPELLPVASKYIFAYITELGIVPPGALFGMVKEGLVR